MCYGVSLDVVCLRLQVNMARARGPSSPRRGAARPAGLLRSHSLHSPACFFRVSITVQLQCGVVVDAVPDDTTRVFRGMKSTRRNICAHAPGQPRRAVSGLMECRAQSLKEAESEVQRQTRQCAGTSRDVKEGRVNAKRPRVIRQGQLLSIRPQTFLFAREWVPKALQAGCAKKTQI